MNQQARNRAEQFAAYIEALKSHDWSFEYSDDQRVWLKGRQELSQLRQMQHDLDPKYELWNEHAPKGYKR